jgi:LAO/AO transport system kinase
VLELADMLVVNKADGDNVLRAEAAASDYQGAFNILVPASPNWRPPVITVSGQENRGLDRLWGEVERHREIMTQHGRARGEAQPAARRMDVVDAGGLAARRPQAPPARRPSACPKLEAEVRAGQMAPQTAVAEISGLMGLGA